MRLDPDRRADPSGIVEFFDIPTGDAFDVAPDRAIAFFRAKGLTPTFSYADMLGEAHDHAFTVAKMMDVDLLGQMRASLDSAMANGTPFREWADSITPILQSAGWWGRKEVVDPMTGKVVVAQLGRPSRLETIFRTNMQSAYAAGQWQEIDAQKDIAPYLMYDAVDDFRTRPLHASWDRTVLKVDHPWWQRHYPPNGWNCRCGVIQLSAEELQALGMKPDVEAPNDGEYTWTNPRTGEKVKVPNGIDPGFDRHAGKSYLDSLKALLAEKAANLAASMKAALAEAQKVTEAASLAARENALALQARANAAADAALARAKALAEQKAKEAAATSRAERVHVDLSRRGVRLHRRAGGQGGRHADVRSAAGQVRQAIGELPAALCQRPALRRVPDRGADARMTVLSFEPLYEQIRAHAAREYPREACGVVLRERALRYVPCLQF